MQVRLAFSVMVQVDADILLIDEVLAVGDAAFQQKCFDVFNRPARRGAHDRLRHPRHGLGAPLLPPGHAHRARAGDGDRQARGRHRRVRRPELRRHRGARPTARRCPPAARPSSWRRGGRTSTASARARCARDARAPSACACASTGPSSTRPSPSCSRTSSTSPLMATSTDWAEQKTGAFAPGDEAVFSRLPRLAFAPGRIYASPWVSRRGARRSTAAPQMVLAASSPATTRSGGLVDLPHEVSLEAGGDGRHRQGREQAMSATTGEDILEARLGRPIRGPSAFGGETRRFFNLTYTLAVTDFKLKFFGSVLGYLWQLDEAARPVRGDVRRLHEGPEGGREGRLLSGHPDREHRPLHLLRRGDDGRCDERRGPRGDRPQDPVPAARDPAGHDAHRAVQPRAEPRRGVRVLRRRRRRPARLGARGAAAHPRPRALHRRDRDDPRRALRAASATSSRSGRSSPRRSTSPRRSSTRSRPC